MIQLVSLDDARTWLGSSAQPCSDGQLTHMLEVASDTIVRFIGYDPTPASYTRIFNGRDNQRMILPDRPVTAVTSVIIDGVAIPPSSSPCEQGFVFDDKSVMLRSKRFVRGWQNVAISYAAGFAAMPADIQDAVIQLVKLQYFAIDRDPDLRGENVTGVYSAQYGASSSFSNGTCGMPDKIAADLKRYIVAAS